MFKLTTRSFAFATVLGVLVLADKSGQGQENSILSRDPPLQLGNQIASPIGIQEPERLPIPFDENLDLLMRAPLHESFAEIPQGNPRPNALIVKRPPADIEEMPPEYRPEGDNVIWIPGYWSWDEDRIDFIWISGVWRDSPPNQRWVSGYWNEEGEGVRWVSGFWAPIEIHELAYLPEPPAPIEVGPSMQAPSDDHYYVPGCWIYSQSSYVWRPGYYSPYLDDVVWVPPTYVWTPCGYVFRPGYYDKPFDQRGTVFAPVYFRVPLYQDVNYRFRPTCVIDTSYNLLAHLFVRPNCNHYYFGDWYADHYRQNGYCAWSSIGSNGIYKNQFDPLYSYYRSPYVRYQNGSVITWAQTRSRKCLHNVDSRPPAAFSISLLVQNSSRRNNSFPLNQNRDDQNWNGSDRSEILARTLQQEINERSENHHGGQGKSFIRVTSQNWEQNRIPSEFSRQRKDREHQLNRQTKKSEAFTNGQPATVRRITLPEDRSETVRSKDSRTREQEVLARKADFQKFIESKKQVAVARSNANSSARKNEGGAAKVSANDDEGPRDRIVNNHDDKRLAVPKEKLSVLKSQSETLNRSGDTKGLPVSSNSGSSRQPNFSQPLNNNSQSDRPGSTKQFPGRGPVTKQNGKVDMEKNESAIRVQVDSDRQQQLRQQTLQHDQIQSAARKLQLQQERQQREQQSKQSHLDLQQRKTVELAQKRVADSARAMERTKRNQEQQNQQSNGRQQRELQTTQKSSSPPIRERQKAPSRKKSP